MGIVAGIMVPHPPLIVPAVGRGGERGIAATVRAYEQAAEFAMSFEPEVLLFVSPHAVMYADYFHVSPGAGASGNFAQFGAPREAFEVSYDAEFVRGLEAAAGKSGFPAGTLGERDKRLDHGVMVPLYFISRAAGKMPKAVRVGLSGLPLTKHYEFGRLIAETAEKLGRRAVVVASGDLSHKLKTDGPYGFSPDGPVYDKRIMDVMGRAAFGELFDFSEDFCESAAECGHRSFVIMAGAFDGRAVRAERLSYEGPFGVGYGVCTFEGGARDDSRRFLKNYAEKEKQRLAAIKSAEDEYVRLARASVEHYVRTGRRAGVFVSLHEDGRLRVPGMGGAMDIVAGAKKVYAATRHFDKNGKCKLVKKCSLPLTGRGAVDVIVTEYCVVRNTYGRMALTDIAEDVSIKELLDKTKMRLDVSAGLVRRRF